MAVKSLIQVRRDSYTNWTTGDKFLSEGEIGYITEGTDAGKFKIGPKNGANWNSISSYANPTDFITAISGSSTTPLSVSGTTLSLQGGFARYTGTGDSHISYPKVTVKSGATGPSSPAVGDVWIKY